MHIVKNKIYFKAQAPIHFMYSILWTFFIFNFTFCLISLGWSLFSQLNQMSSELLGMVRMAGDENELMLTGELL